MALMALMTRSPLDVHPCRIKAAIQAAVQHNDGNSFALCKYPPGTVIKVYLQVTLPTPHAHIVRLLLLACFLSGAASLSFEVLWTRAFSLILGSTTQAAALVFAAFLTGLALGAWLFGSLSARLRAPLRTYALLEVGIAFTAVATGLLLHYQADTIGALLGVGSTRYLLAFLLVLLMVLPPTLLMGGTLPVLLTVARAYDERLSVVGKLYGWNTFGAAAGTFICGFFTIRLLGVTSAYYFAMALNLVVAVIAFILSLRTSDTKPVAPVSSSTTSQAPLRHQPDESYLFMIALGSGAAVLSLELVWARFASFFLGNRTYAFTTLMFAVLTLLATGSWLSAWLYQRMQRSPAQDPRRIFAMLLVAGALAVALSGWGGWWLISNQVDFESGLPALQKYVLVYRFIEAFALLALPLITLGALFPLTIALSRHCAADIGATSARYYGVNTIGVVVGSLGTGFIGLGIVGSFGMLKLITVLLLLLALVSLVKTWRPLPVASIVLAIAALVVMITLPSSYPDGLAPGERLVVEEEDAHGLFRVTRLKNGRLQVTNNRSELIYHLGAFSTDYVQQMQGHLGMHFKPDSTTALVIGSGYGITAGALALYDGIERVDALEILPAMVSSADLFEPNNFSYHKNDKVQVQVGDGRHFLLREDRQYDIISLNVSDPHLPGGSTLFHREFYELAKRHLKPRGVVIQHVFGSERAVIANTMAAAFPYTRFSRSYSNGYNAVASMSDLRVQASRRMDLPPRAMAQLRTHAGRRITTRPLYLSYERLPASMQTDLIATDDRPAVEFSWNTGEKLLFINE
jgi:spermidine synthase